MKIRLRRFLSLFLALLLTLPTALSMVALAEESESATEEITTEGVSFKANQTYTLPSSVNKAPFTFETVINVPLGTGRAGVIMGNFNDNIDTVCFEIHENGKPRLYAKESGILIDIKFNVDIRSDDYVHLAFTVDTETQTAYCYVNGELKAQSQNSNFANFANYTPTNPYMIGGDCRSGNSQYFKGKIKNVAFYSDLRTGEEIASDASKNMNNLASLDKDNIVAAYDLTKGVPDSLSDLSGNNYSISYSDPEYDKVLLETGMTFASSDSYKMDKVLKSSHYPATIEATLFVPKSQAERAGSILGNYRQDTHSMTFEIYNSGQPRLFFCSSESSAIIELTFNQVDIRTSGWVNLAVTLDFVNGVATCYVNGVEMQQLSIPGSIIESSVYSTELYLGRDTRAERYFKGALKDLTIYSDIRSPEEIAQDSSSVDLTDENIVASYNFLEETGRTDITENGYTFYAEGETTPDDGGDTGDDGTGDDGTGDDTTGSGITTLDGLTFVSSDYAILQKTFKDNAPYTFEATILVPSTVTGRAGIILGNHTSNSYKYLNFEIYENGVPRLCFTNPNSLNDVNTFNYLFSDVHVNTGEVVHLAITLDPATGKACCYIDGVQKQAITKKAFAFGNDFFENYAFVLGNDPRSSGAGGQCFKGTIGNVTVYSDTRTSSEIATDYQGINLENDNLILYYDLSGATSGENITDLSGNGYDVEYKTRGFADLKSWISDKEPVTDYLYSFAVVGDTQIIAQKHPTDFHMIYDWILNNQKDKNIQYVFGLGDITNNNSSAEWTVAAQNIFRLNGVIPHSAIRGNHDSVSSYNNIFTTNSDYMSQFDGFYTESDATSTYRAITIGDVKYLMVTLDYGASDSVLSWASGVIESHPDHKVIITTHAYLYRDGTTLDQGDVCPPATNGGYNNGDHIWDKLISKHENIFMVISGHDPSANVVVSQATGVNGNLVTQMLVDPQGVDTSTPTGMVTMLYFKADGSIEVETYSTIQDKYYKESNQFVISETAHSYIDDTFVYENGYLKPGALTSVCESCGNTHVFETGALIEFYGYSISTFNTSSICAGYRFDFDLIHKYEELNNTTFTIGLVAAPYDYLETAGKPINSDGTVNNVSQGKVISYTLEKEYPLLDIILKSSDWNSYADHKTVLCAYIIENGNVSYLCDTEEMLEEATYVTYAELVAELNNTQ